jgi:hypothetical protein
MAASESIFMLTLLASSRASIAQVIGYTRTFKGGYEAAIAGKPAPTV